MLGTSQVIRLATALTARLGMCLMALPLGRTHIEHEPTETLVYWPESN